jgi:hypothetical protein
MDFFELMFGGAQAIQAIFGLGFIPKEDDFREFSNEEYMCFHEKELDICGKMYTFKSERLVMGNDIYAFSEEEKNMMLKGAENLKRICGEQIFISDDAMLKYAAQHIPGVFTKGTKYERTPSE